MGTFKGRFFLISLISFLLCSFFLFYSIYRVSHIDDLVEQDKRFFIPSNKELSYLEAMFRSYQLDVNKMISQPAKYDPYDIQNNPLKLEIDEKLELLSRMIYSFYSRYNIDEAAKHMDLVENISKSFRNYNVSASAVVEAFSEQNISVDKGFSNISEFVSIIRKSEDDILKAINDLSYDWNQKVVLGTKNLAKQFNGMTVVLTILWLVLLISLVAVAWYAKNLSDKIMFANTTLSKIATGRYSPIDIISHLPNASNFEVFELLNSISKLSNSIYDDMEGFKNRINFLENDNARNKVVATYTSSILNSIDTAILVTDDMLRVSFVNDEFEKIWKIKRSNLIDSELIDLPFVRMVGGWKEALSNVLLSDSKKTELSFKGNFKVSTKTKKNLEFRIMPLKTNSSKKILGTVSIMREITK
jgi:nitrogen fixation/metabolism regulation signal transduction histidine kinase